MRLLFRQRMFSWFDSYDIYDENGNTVYVVKGQLSWGHLLNIYDAYENKLGYVQERVLTFLPKFEIYEREQYLGCISKEFTFLSLNIILILIWMAGRRKLARVGLHDFAIRWRCCCNNLKGTVTYDRYLCA